MRTRQPDAPLTVAEAAASKNVSEGTIRSLCRKGLILFHRVGPSGRGAIRIEVEDLKAWWDSTLEDSKRAVAGRISPVRDHFAHRAARAASRK